MKMNFSTKTNKIYINIKKKKKRRKKKRQKLMVSKEFHEHFFYFDPSTSFFQFDPFVLALFRI